VFAAMIVVDMGLDICATTPCAPQLSEQVDVLVTARAPAAWVFPVLETCTVPVKNPAFAPGFVFVAMMVVDVGLDICATTPCAPQLAEQVDVLVTARAPAASVFPLLETCNVPVKEPAFAPGFVFVAMMAVDTGLEVCASRPCAPQLVHVDVLVAVRAPKDCVLPLLVTVTDP
jgi:hypothetical protein